MSEIGAKQFLRMDPEKAHNYAVTLAKYNIVPYDRTETDPVLSSDIWGLTFKNPVRFCSTNHCVHTSLEECFAKHCTQLLDCSQTKISSFSLFSPLMDILVSIDRFSRRIWQERRMHGWHAQVINYFSRIQSLSHHKAAIYNRTTVWFKCTCGVESLIHFVCVGVI